MCHLTQGLTESWQLCYGMFFLHIQMKSKNQEIKRWILEWTEVVTFSLTFVIVSRCEEKLQPLPTSFFVMPLTSDTNDVSDHIMLPQHLLIWDLNQLFRFWSCISILIRTLLLMKSRCIELDVSDVFSTASLWAAEVCGSCGGLQTGQGYRFANGKCRDEGHG